MSYEVTVIEIEKIKEGKGKVDMADRKERELRMIRQQLQRRNKRQVTQCGNGLIKAILIGFVIVIIAIAIGLAILVF